jgi:hypothetical protein
MSTLAPVLATDQSSDGSAGGVLLLALLLWLLLR